MNRFHGSAEPAPGMKVFRRRERYYSGIADMNIGGSPRFAREEPQARRVLTCEKRPVR